MKKMKRWKKVLLGILAVLLILVAGAFLVVRRMFSQASIDKAAASENAVVQTDKGLLRGSEENDVYQYLGVPYAQATRRFEPAQEVPAWDGIRDTTQVSAMSPQSGMLGMSAGSQQGTDNNCQNLNIWTPGIDDGKKRAVMVWLHGGGFSSGTANSEQYNGAALSQAGDVVVVSVNHRLGVSGYLDLSAYGAEYRYSANAGLDDLVKALQWIHTNIEAFGGDPDNVTLFGQSGGGAKILALMTTPYAKGLFQRGIVQSGATETMGVTFTHKEASQRLTEHILENLGLNGQNVEELQTRPLDEIETAAQTALQQTAEEYKIPAPLTDGYAMEWGPVVEGEYLPTDPVTADGFAESGRDVELLIGSNLNEWTMFMGGDQGTLTAEETAAFAQAYPMKDTAKANKVDTLIRLPMLKIMSHKADQNGAAVYAYVFTYDNNRSGAYHGAEIPFVFRHMDGENAALAAQISDAWVNFAKTGVPGAEGLPQWEPYDRERAATMLLDTTSTLVYGHDKQLMQLLAPNYQY